VRSLAPPRAPTSARAQHHRVAGRIAHGGAARR